jgi:hypothetical protein
VQRTGQIRGPAGPSSDARPIDDELGQLLTGVCEGRTRPEGIVARNPFDLAIKALALAR